MSITTTKQKVKSARRQKKMTQPETAPKEVKPTVKQPNPDFDRQLLDHFAAEERKKVEEAAESVFGSVLARHGWVRNEHGQVEYIGEGA